jgi:hypothetical protein
MNVTLDVGTVVVTVMCIVIAGLVYQWTEPAAPTMPTVPASGMSKGEKVVTALTAAVAVIAIGSFIVHGVKGIELPREGPSPVPSVKSTITSR